MSYYIHFTEEQKEQARHTDIADMLIRQGETLKRSGTEYEWRDGYQKITIRGNLWFNQYERVGRNTIDFVMKYFSKTYSEAVEYLIGESGGSLITSPTVEKKEKLFELPKRNNNMRRVFSYLLNQRKIDKDILNTFANKNMIYESEKYHNAVFVGYDLKDEPRHANKRGIGKESTYKGNSPGSKPEYSFHWNGTNDKIYLFEAPIDMLSYISMNKENWEQNSYAASCSVSDRVLFQYLKDNPTIKEVYLCFDNDKPGQEAAKRISDKLLEQNITAEILIPIHKDWNEDLIFQNQEDNKWEMQLC